MARETISALEDGDQRGLELLLRITAITGLPPDEIVERIETYARYEVNESA